jgi:hypothetical protein
LEEGDATYLPTFWWHAVESPVDDGFGITVAYCWQTPEYLFDPRLAGVRWLLRKGPKNLGTKRYAGMCLRAARSLAHFDRLGRPAYDE